MNIVLMIGRIVADPETRTTESGMMIAKYRLAVDRQFKRDGEPTADFFNCTAFGKAGEFADRYLNKGMKIAIEGRLQTGSYTNKDGNKVYTTDIIVERHEFCESKGSRSDSGEVSNPHEMTKAEIDEIINVETDEELPFN